MACGNSDNFVDTLWTPRVYTFGTDADVLKWLYTYDNTLAYSYVPGSTQSLAWNQNIVHPSAPVVGSLTRTVATTRGAQYTISLRYRSTRIVGTASSTGAAVTLSVDDYNAKTAPATAQGSAGSAGWQVVTVTAFTSQTDALKISVGWTTPSGAGANDLAFDSLQVTRVFDGVGLPALGVLSYRLTDFRSGAAASLASSAVADYATGVSSSSVGGVFAGGSFTAREAAPGYAGAGAAAAYAMQLALAMPVPTINGQTSAASSVTVAVTPRTPTFLSPLTGVPNGLLNSGLMYVLTTNVRSSGSQNCVLVALYGGVPYNALPLSGCAGQWQTFQSLPFLFTTGAVSLQLQCYGAGNQAVVGLDDIKMTLVV